MSESARIIWRWAERDYGFRFKEGAGKKAAEYYQAQKPGEFYTIPTSQRKWDKDKVDALCALITKPTAPSIVANPWHDYGNTDHQRITAHGGDPCLNVAGCFDPSELIDRETHGVNRAKALIADLAQRDEPVAITLDLVSQVHKEMLGDIYPWAGEWRTVALHKGEGATRWPLPPFGMEPVLEEFARDVLTQTPFISDDDDAVIAFLARFLGDYLALHPFREGNGRSAFIIGDLILLQNGLATLDIYNRKRDEARYFEACDAARLCDYAPLAKLLEEWQAERQAILAQQIGEQE
jgi:cell filamentation protein